MGAGYFDAMAIVWREHFRRMRGLESEPAAYADRERLEAILRDASERGRVAIRKLESKLREIEEHAAEVVPS